MYVEKTRTWDDNFNDIIRTVFFTDDKLKEQMCVPEGTTIMQFIEKYFIMDASPDEILTNEPVRVVCYDTEGLGQRNMHVRGNYKNFDIFVQQKVLHTAGQDRLQRRTSLIAERIKYQLLRNTNICHLRFYYEDEYDLWTKVVGYKRYHLTFFYYTTV